MNHRQTAVEAEQYFRSYFRPQPRETSTWFVPGRIEVMGKHTDYAGGRSLLSAVDAGITIHGQVTAPSNPSIIRVTSDVFPDELVISLDQLAQYPAGHWGRYVVTVISRLQQNFPGQLGSAKLQLSSTLPPASGMSSSSALMIAVASTLIDLFGLAGQPDFTANLKTLEDYAAYCGGIEGGGGFRALAGQNGVGTFGGSQDHVAILCAKPNALVGYRFAPVVYEETLPLPASEWKFVVATSGILAEKTGAALQDYNRVSLAVRQIVSRWNQAQGTQHPTLYQALYASSTDQDEGGSELDPQSQLERNYQQMRQLVADDDYLAGRLDQYMAESESLIPAAREALKAGNFAQFGKYVAQSMKQAEVGLKNQVPETIALVELAKQHGAIAASAFGAGFGGSVYALVQADQAEAFAQAWMDAYEQQYPGSAAQAEVLITGAAPGAARLDR